MGKKRRKSSKTNSSLLKRVSSVLIRIFLWFLMVSVLLVIVYRFVNPPITLLMVLRNIERKSEDRPTKLEKEWVDFADISDNMKRAAVAAEDQLFLKHVGFDVKAIERAYKNNVNSKRVKGGSTISQQTAKNVFLWPGRSWVRKGFEAYFTLLIEMFWSKERILEVYLNVIEMGDGVYGAEAAAQANFNKSCRKLTRSQAALIAACFPNPRKWSPKRPTSYINHRKYLIMKNMRILGPLDF